MQNQRHEHKWWLAVMLAGLTLVLHWMIILSRGFDGLYGQDAFAYYDYALQLRERILHLHMPPPFYWPIGYPALIVAGTAVVGLSPQAGQIVSSIAGAGVVAFTYLLAHDLLAQQGLSASAARWIGLVSGLLAAGCGQLWQWSITIMADAPALFWATLAAWGLVRYARTHQIRWLSLLAVALAWATMTRWIYALLAVPFAIYWILTVGARRRVALRHLFIAGLVGLVALAPQIALSAVNPAPVLEHQWLLGWSPLNAVRRQFETVDGYAAYPLPVVLFYAKAAISPRYLFPLFTPFLLLGLVTGIRRRWWPALALLAGWGAVIYGFLIGIPYQNFRFTLALLPAEAVLAGIGLRQGWEWLAPRLRPLLLAYVLIGLLGGIWYSARVLDEFIDRKEADLQVTRWVESQVPDGERVLAFGLTLMLQHYTALDTHEIFYLAPADLDVLLADGRQTYLLVAVESLEQQWAGHPPQRAYRYLRDGPGLIDLGSKYGYTLFRVGGSSSSTPGLCFETGNVKLKAQDYQYAYCSHYPWLQR